MRILYLDLDTLRPDHLGCYGYHRNTSPNIDRIAREGTRFDNCYCSDAPCLPSRTALMSGRFGIHTGGIGHGGTCGDMRLEGSPRGFKTRHSQTSLPAFLKNRGLHTAFIGGFGERHSAWHFYAGFREIHDTGKSGMESAEDVTPTLMRWIEANARNDNWYLQVNYWDPHTPYRAPQDFGNPFENDPLPAWLTEEVVHRHTQVVGPHTSQELSMYDDSTNQKFPRMPGRVRDMRDLRRVIDGYDCGTRYMDEHIGRILDAFARAGVLDDLAIVVSSDHGENLGELGIYSEHATADQITCRIPMIVRWPGGRQNHVDKGLHYNLDLVPTLAELFSRPPHPQWDGQSFAPAVLKGQECGQPYLVISQCAHVCQRGVRWGSNLYMKTYHDGYHLFPEEMLFDLASDPHEQNDLAAAKPDLCRDAVYYLDQWHTRMMHTMPEGYDTDPMWTVIKEGGPSHARGYLSKYCERLEATGRGWAVPELTKRHPREFSGKPK